MPSLSLASCFVRPYQCNNKQWLILFWDALNPLLLGVNWCWRCRHFRQARINEGFLQAWKKLARCLSLFIRENRKYVDFGWLLSFKILLWSFKKPNKVIYFTTYKYHCIYFATFKKNFSSSKNIRTVPYFLFFTHFWSCFTIRPLTISILVHFYVDTLIRRYLKSLYLLSTMICVDLGNSNSLTPAIAAWLPVLFFGALGFTLFDGIETWGLLP